LLATSSGLLALGTFTVVPMIELALKLGLLRIDGNLDTGWHGITLGGRVNLSPARAACA
jgi:hypothetical protein